MATPLESRITTDATRPKSHQVEGEKAETRPLTELIAADRYLSGLAARSAGKTGLTFAKFKRGGAVTRADDAT